MSWESLQNQLLLFSRSFLSQEQTKTEPTMENKGDGDSHGQIDTIVKPTGNHKQRTPKLMSNERRV